VKWSNHPGHPVKVTDAARRVGINPNLIHRWKLEFEQETKGTRLTADEREELTRLRRENRQLLMETDILKKATAYFAKHSK
jgi:transposase